MCYAPKVTKFENVIALGSQPRLSANQMRRQRGGGEEEAKSISANQNLSLSWPHLE